MTGGESVVAGLRAALAELGAAGLLEHARFEEAEGLLLGAVSLLLDVVEAVDLVAPLVFAEALCLAADGHFGGAEEVLVAWRRGVLGALEQL